MPLRSRPQAGAFFDKFFDDLFNSGPRRDPNATSNNNAAPAAAPQVEQELGADSSLNWNTPTGAAPQGLEAYLRMLGGGMGGFGGGFWNSGGGGGNHGRTDDLEAIMLSGRLPDLDKATLERLEQMKQAQLMAAMKVFGEGKDALLEDLFGRGVNRSTIAGEAGERMLTGQAQTLSGIESDAAQRYLGLQSQLADRRLQGASSAGQIRASMYASDQQRAVGMANAQAQVAAARMNNATRMALGMQELDLKRDLGFGELALGERSLAERARQFDEGLDFQRWAFEESQPSFLDKILGFAGAVIPKLPIPGLGG